MENQAKRFITRFRKAHDLYGKYISLWDVKNFLMGQAYYEGLYDICEGRLSYSDFKFRFCNELCSKGVIEYLGYILDLSPLLEDMDAQPIVRPFKLKPVLV